MIPGITANHAAPAFRRLYGARAAALDPPQTRRMPAGSFRVRLGVSAMTAPSSFSRLATVYGGSGFLGRYIVGALVKQGWRVRAAVRRPDLAGHLQPLGLAGQISPVQANLRFPDSVRAAAEGADLVINLVGILYETGRQKFDVVQGEGAGVVAEAAAAVGAKMIHMSAIGADARHPAAYARAKAKGEELVLKATPDAVIFRPSLVFGTEDGFFNRFAAMARLSPFLPLVGGGDQRYQPVYVGDVTKAVMAAVEGRAKPGTVYELGGPAVRTFEELMRYILEVTERKRLLLPIPFAIAELQALFLQFAPGGPILTPDQVKLLTRDNVVSEAAKAEGRTLEGLGIDPTPYEAVVPDYLWRFRKTGQFRKGRAA
jgi:NADH dehydrogenase